MRFKLALLTLLMSLSAPLAAHAESALGVVLGDPSGLSARHRVDAGHSLEGALAFSAGHRRGFHIHGTYLWDKARTFVVEHSNIVELYYGLGFRLINIDGGRYNGDVALGPRAPLGLLYKIDNPNLEFFAELSLALDIVPSIDVDLDAGIGVRIRF
ncbi:hypothetical protein BDW_06115 [Bdellovibrio bacteriovorus W]|nr:hypothetical protein BDW_06115 [Bdellovibrio bacteriovorus W]